jgi:hypothetical protein
MLPIHETEAIPKFAESDFYVLGWVEGKEEGRVQGNPMSDSGKEKEPLGR